MPWWIICSCVLHKIIMLHRHQIGFMDNFFLFMLNVYEVEVWRYTYDKLFEINYLKRKSRTGERIQNFEQNSENLMKIG